MIGLLAFAVAIQVGALSSLPIPECGPGNQIVTNAGKQILSFVGAEFWLGRQNHPFNVVYLAPKPGFPAGCLLVSCVTLFRCYEAFTLVLPMPNQPLPSRIHGLTSQEFQLLPQHHYVCRLEP